MLRHRIGPVTAVERQIAHIWGGSVAAVVLLFVVEWLLALPVLTLSPVLGLIGGAVFVAKAGILSGIFYLQAIAMFASALVMAELERRGIDYGVALYGLISALAFFLPGWKYYRQSRAARIAAIADELLPLPQSFDFLTHLDTLRSMDICSNCLAPQVIVSAHHAPLTHAPSIQGLATFVDRLLMGN